MIGEQEAGMATTEVCRKHGLSPAIFHELKAKFGGMELSDARRLKALEDENAKLERPLSPTARTGTGRSCAWPISGTARAGASRSGRPM
jgi:hypothetical protein